MDEQFSNREDERDEGEEPVFDDGTDETEEVEPEPIEASEEDQSTAFDSEEDEPAAFESHADAEEEVPTVDSDESEEADDEEGEDEHEYSDEDVIDVQAYAVEAEDEISEAPVSEVGNYDEVYSASDESSADEDDSLEYIDENAPGEDGKYDSDRGIGDDYVSAEIHDDPGPDEYEEGDPEESGDVTVEEIVDDTLIASRLERTLGSVWLLAGAVLAGILLRGLWYWKQSSIGAREADLFSEISSLTFGGLFRPLEHEIAPPALLATAKMGIAALGDEVIGLRVVPMLATMLALIAMAWAARRIVGGGAALLSVALLAISWPAIQAAGELRNFSADVLASAIILGLGAHMLSGPATRGKLILFGAAGAVLVWISMPVVFMLAGVGGTLVIRALAQKNTKAEGFLSLVVLAWAGSFLGYYFLNLAKFPSDEAFQVWYHDSFALLPPDRTWLSAGKWLVWSFVDLFANPVGLVLPGLGVLGFLAGLLLHYRKRIAIVSMLLLPMLVALAASITKQYPMEQHFLQFLIPSVVIITSAGLAEITRHLWNARRGLAVLFIVVIFAQPLAVVINNLIKPGDLGAQPAVEYLADHVEADDEIYLNYWIRNEVRYYARNSESLDYDAMTVGVAAGRNLQEYGDAIRAFAGASKVWFLLHDNELNLRSGDHRYLETRLNALGTQLSYESWPGYHLYAYDLSELKP